MDKDTANDLIEKIWTIQDRLKTIQNTLSDIENTIAAEVPDER